MGDKVPGGEEGADGLVCFNLADEHHLAVAFDAKVRGLSRRLHQVLHRGSAAFGHAVAPQKGRPQPERHGPDVPGLGLRVHLDDLPRLQRCQHAVHGGGRLVEVL